MRTFESIAKELRVYHGRSMGATFRGGDFLILEDVPFEQIRVGDVVVFWGAEASGGDDPERLVVVHRVRACQPGGLLTWGDANPGPDNGLLGPDRLIGRVRACERARRGGAVKRYPVWNGPAGMFWLVFSRLHWIRLAAWGWRGLRRLLGPLYRALRASRLVGRVWRPAVLVLRLQTRDGCIFKAVVAGKTVAYRAPTMRHMRCRKPYDLIVDESRLSQPSD